MMKITKEWFERRAKAEADLEIGAGFSVVNMTDDDIARMEVVAERGLPQWAQDELAKLRAALASRDVTEEPVAVKALGWSEHEQSTAAGDHCAKTPFGDYEIGLPHLYWIVVMPNGVVSDGFDTIKEAKAAAQADYETRVLSALSRPLPLPREEKMREAIREFNCPRPFNGRPEDFTAGQCLDAGECGCMARAAIGDVQC
jgi:hypothetical protein